VGLRCLRGYLDAMSSTNAATAVPAVRAWLRDTIVGLDLCPFAGGPLRAGRVRIAESHASDLHGALTDLMVEARHLREHDRVETTLLVLPALHLDFEDFLDATALGEQLLADAGHHGVLQVVAFHPDFRFEGADPGDPANAVNRSPAPLWHLLRESSVARAVEAYDGVEEIPERNARLLRERG